MDLIGNAVAVSIVLGIVLVLVALILDVLRRFKRSGTRARRRR
jgi:hypothetical protein